MNLKQTFQKWLAEGDIKQIIDTLRKQLPDNQSVLLISARYHRYLRELHQGTLSREQAGVEWAQLCDALAWMLASLELPDALPTATAPSVTLNIQNAGIVITGDHAQFIDLKQSFQ